MQTPGSEFPHLAPHIWSVAQESAFWKGARDASVTLAKVKNSYSGATIL